MVDNTRFFMDGREVTEKEYNNHKTQEEQTMSEADVKYALVAEEMKKLMMCKRGVMETEQNDRAGAIYNERHYNRPRPLLKLKDREAIYKKNRKALLSCLKYAPSKDLCHLSGNGDGKIKMANMFTVQSKKAYKDKCDALFTHPDHQAWIDEGKMLDKKRAMIRPEIDGRIAEMEAEFKALRMSLATGTVPFENFEIELEKLEAREW